MMLSILATLMIGLWFFIAHHLRQAPEAYEDEAGFNLVWSNDDPERANIACIWTAGVEYSLSFSGAGAA
jgi:hypothetical protein